MLYCSLKRPPWERRLTIVFFFRFHREDMCIYTHNRRVSGCVYSKKKRTGCWCWGACQWSTSFKNLCLTGSTQYTSLLSTRSVTIQCEGWRVKQISFITGARSVNKQDLSKNLKFFNVTEASIQSIYSKLALRVFDVYANILKCMYITRFSGGPTRSEASPEAQPTPIVVNPLFRTMSTFCPDKYKKRKKECQKAEDK